MQEYFPIHVRNSVERDWGSEAIIISLRFASIEALCTALNLDPSLAEKLRKMGFETPEALATATVEELMYVGLDVDTSRRILREIRDSLPFLTLSGEDLLMEGLKVQRITTGSKALDDALGGGVETRNITEFFGESGTGKSQICHQLCVNVGLPEEMGGILGGALYIDADNTFRPERICQMAKRFKLDPMEVLKGIHCVKVVNSDHQIFVVDKCEEILKRHKVRLIIVDSLTTHFRGDYPGKELLPKRQLSLTKHISRLKELSKAFDLAVVVTNHVISSPEEPFGEALKAAGGFAISYAVRTRLYLRKAISPNLRIARLVSSPYLSEREVIFRIAEGGIEDIREGEV
ncbi:DNA repair and recombination protein RadA [Candidatus Bathyarchaeota archaeon]|nr:DNA repair and recombination protein RadA [Candidatus Bathyarchaeota archaeon]MBS7627481.1 DNA repair and recombination protein RadA [Candidatus Bathyarchaeota archaeon]